ncbi:hypothetical protein AB0N14_10215 [Streptomyces sp. NPDC051104]
MRWFAGGPYLCASAGSGWAGVGLCGAGRGGAGWAWLPGGAASVDRSPAA